MQELSRQLVQVVASAESVLRNIEEEKSEKPFLPGGWSRKQVIGHLIDSASNNHQRFVRASLEGALEFPEYEQEGWARIQAANEESWMNLLTLWTSYNRHLSHVIAHLPADKLEAQCRIGGDEPITLRGLARGYMSHLLHHLAQLGVA